MKRNVKVSVVAPSSAPLIGDKRGIALVRDLIAPLREGLPADTGLWGLHDWFRAKCRRSLLGDVDTPGYFATCVAELIDHTHFVSNECEIVSGRPPKALQPCGPGIWQMAHGTLRASKVLLKCALLAIRRNYRQYLKLRRSTLDDLCLELSQIDQIEARRAFIGNVVDSVAQLLSKRPWSRGEDQYIDRSILGALFVLYCIPSRDGRSLSVTHCAAPEAPHGLQDFLDAVTQHQRMPVKRAEFYQSLWTGCPTLKAISDADAFMTLPGVVSALQKPSCWNDLRRLPPLTSDLRFQWRVRPRSRQVAACLNFRSAMAYPVLPPLRAVGSAPVLAVFCNVRGAFNDIDRLTLAAAAKLIAACIAVRPR